MEEIMNVDSWQQTPRTWKTNTWTKKQTLLREKNIRNEKKKKDKDSRKVADANTQTVQGSSVVQPLPSQTNTLT